MKDMLLLPGHEVSLTAGVLVVYRHGLSNIVIFLHYRTVSHVANPKVDYQRLIITMDKC